MYYFIVGKWQDKVFTVLIHHAERHLVMVILAIDRIFFHVRKSVIHPAHIPFEIKA